MESYVTITITPESGTIHCDRPLLTSKGKPQQRLIDALSAACQPAYLGVEDPLYFFPDLVVYRDQIDVFLELATEEGWIEKGAIVVNEESTDETFDDDEQFDEPFVTLIRLNPGGRLLCNKPLRRELIAILGHYFSVEVDELGRFHPKIIGEDLVVRFLSNCEQWIQNGAIAVKEKAREPDLHVQVIPVTGDIIPHVPTKPEAPTSDIETRLTRVEQESTEAKKRLDAGFTELKRLDTVLSALESGLPNLLDQQ